MLALLRRRTRDDDVENGLCVLASDRDLPLLTGALGDGACSLVTIANAVHWMDAPGCSPHAAACSRRAEDVRVTTLTGRR